MINEKGGNGMKSTINVEERVSRVAPDIYQIILPTPFPIGDINVYLIEGSSLTLVDTGAKTDEAWEVLVNAIKKCGYRMNDIDQVVLTHQHPDHCGLVERIREVSNARVLGHPLIAPFIKQDQEFFNYYLDFYKSFYRNNGVPSELIQTLVENSERNYGRYTEQSEVHTFLFHKQMVPNLNDWQVLYTPGHAQGHLSLLRKSDGIMIGGDLIFTHIATNPLIEPPYPSSGKRPMTLIQYQNSLQMCCKEKIRIVFSGHGKAVVNFKELAQFRLNRNWIKAERIRKLLNKERKTAFQLVKLLFPNRDNKELLSTLSDTLGHLDLLVMLHQVKAAPICGVTYYYLDT